MRACRMSADAPKQEAHKPTTASYVQKPSCATPVDPSTALQVMCSPANGESLTFTPSTSGAATRNTVTCSCSAGPGRDATPVSFFINVQVGAERLAAVIVMSVYAPTVLSYSLPSSTGAHLVPLR